MIVRDIRNVLFVDIETVPAFKIYDEMPEILKECWKSKTNKESNSGSALDMELQYHYSYHEKAGLFPEFLKVVCVSFGAYDTTGKFIMKSFCSDNEFEILTESAKVIKTHFNKSIAFICAFNGKGFDFPVLSKRMFINNIQLPDALITHNKKPWELTQFIDPYELWKFGSQQSASLRLLSYLLLGVDAKELMSGADVREYANNKRWNEIQRYCEMDVDNLAKVFTIMDERL